MDMTRRPPQREAASWKGTTAPAAATSASAAQWGSVRDRDGRGARFVVSVTHVLCEKVTAMHACLE